MSCDQQLDSRPMFRFIWDSSVTRCNCIPWLMFKFNQKYPQPSSIKSKRINIGKYKNNICIYLIYTIQFCIQMSQLGLLYYIAVSNRLKQSTQYRKSDLSGVLSNALLMIKDYFVNEYHVQNNLQLTSSINSSITGF